MNVHGLAILLALLGGSGCALTVDRIPLTYANQLTAPRVANAAGNSVNYTTSTAYDGVGNRISVIDNNGNRTDTVYNSNNLVRQVTDASGNITQFAYDADLNQVSIVVGAQLGATARQILKFDYDQKDRLISDTDALGNTRHYAYDGANNQISATDANGNTTHYTYDRDNRLLTETKPAVADPVTGQPVRYTIQHQYDANGNQIAVTDQDGHTTRMSFDKDNRAVLVQDANGIQTVYTFDSRGNRTNRSSWFRNRLLRDRPPAVYAAVAL